tara:strand:+ start:453 stop:896 length:444 start_codon:yes stop_codon:yes gene_type:complete
MKLPHYIQITKDIEYGDSKLCRIRLNPEYKDDKGLIEHEYTHVKQWYVGVVVGLILTLFAYLVSDRVDYTFYTLMLAPFWKGFAYTFIKPCRLFLEVQAFAAQISIEPKEQQGAYIKAYAKSLVDNYNLSITEEVAERKLRAKVASV